jgi:hypothetical protein
MFEHEYKKLRSFGPLANYTDRATAACWRSSANFLLIEGVAWSSQRMNITIYKTKFRLKTLIE